MTLRTWMDPSTLSVKMPKSAAGMVGFGPVIVFCFDMAPSYAEAIGAYVGVAPSAPPSMT